MYSYSRHKILPTHPVFEISIQATGRLLCIKKHFKIFTALNLKVYSYKNYLIIMRLFALRQTHPYGDVFIKCFN